MDDRNQGNRSRDDIISELENLSHEDGFVYTMCGLVSRSLFYPPEDAAEINWKERPNTQELSYLLGLMIKKALHVDRVPSVEASERQFNAAKKLLDELHATYSSNFATTEPNSNRGATSTNGTEEVQFDDDEMIEAIFYGPTGAHDFSYMEMAIERYQRDAQWISSNIGISLQSIVEIANSLKQILETRFNQLNEPLSFERFSKDRLEVFTFQHSDLPDVSREQWDAFVNVFSLEPGNANVRFRQLGEFNEAQCRPLFKIAEDRFIFLVSFDLAESIYLSPFYWMWPDSAYKKCSDEHRGEAIEEIAHQLLTGVFGSGNVHRNIKIQKSRDDVTDIDVLAVHGNRAVVVQAKSKKLTLEARAGKVEALKRDFDDAIQSAYEQGLVARSAITSGGVTFRDSNGAKLELPDTIDDVYIVCLTGEDYPATVAQIKKYLARNPNDPYPLAISLFDLEVISYYLDNPVDLLYYLRQRTVHHDYFVSVSELSFLGYHLVERLIPFSKSDLLYIDPQSYFLHIDSDYMVEKGQYPESARPENKFWDWRNPQFDELVATLKRVGFGKYTDVAFFLYDIGNVRLEKMLRLLSRLEDATKQRGKLSDATLEYESGSRGVSLLVYPMDHTFARKHFGLFADARKYKVKASEWLAFGKFEGSSNMFDMVSYNDLPWEYDPEMEQKTSVLLKPAKVGLLDVRKISRNEKCPCGSGRKFKRCHGSRLT